MNYYEWEFRTKLRVANKKGEHYYEAVSKIVDGLRGDAFVVAQEVGLEALWEEGGIDELTKKMREMVFPLTTQEAKELFRQYTKPNGLLSRQVSESMKQYISRRSRCWRLLKELDHEIELGEGHRADMLLDLAGLDKNERTMIQASIGNQRDFNKISDALITQHPRIHVNEQRRRTPGKGKGKSKSRGYGKGYLSSGRGKGKFVKRAYFGEERDDEEYDAYEANDYPEESEDKWGAVTNNPVSYPGDVNDSSNEDADAFAAEEDEQYEEMEVHDPVEASELNSVAFLVESYGDADAFKDASAAAEFVQNATALLGFKGKGKGKGKTGRYPIRHSTLSVQDRRKKLEELKKRTECRRCGRTGHWSGDPACSMSKGDGKQRTASIATRISSSSSSFYIDDDASDENKDCERIAHMMINYILDDDVIVPKEEPECGFLCGYGRCQRRCCLRRRHRGGHTCGRHTGWTPKRPPPVPPPRRNNGNEQYEHIATCNVIETVQDTQCAARCRREPMGCHRRCCYRYGHEGIHLCEVCDDDIISSGEGTTPSTTPPTPTDSVERVAYMHVKLPASVASKAKAKSAAARAQTLARVEEPLPFGFESNRYEQTPQMPVPMNTSGPGTEFPMDSSFDLVEEELVNVKFNAGVFKGKTFHDVLHDHPSYYLKVHKQKKLPGEIEKFVQWVD